MRHFLPLVALLLGCGDAPDDSGLIVRDGVELSQPEIPVCVFCDLEGCEEALTWWNEQLGFVVFTSGGEQCPISVREEYLNSDVLGVATLSWTPEGDITRCTVRMNEPTWRPLYLKHELGHCLGLDDDYPSRELNSVMSSPTYGGGVTDYDRDLLWWVYGRYSGTDTSPKADH